MIDLYYWPTPNGHKITLFLEEAGLDYTVHPVDIGAGDQFKPEFLAFSPNNKMPAIIDNAPADGGLPITVFESGAILVYLANKTGKFFGADVRQKVEVNQWLMWQMAGLGPMTGQYGHFNVYAPEPIPYAIDRYTREVQRLLGVLDKRLDGRDFIAGPQYTIADMACYPWIDPYDKAPMDLSDYPNLRRWRAAIAERPGTVRAYEVADRHRVQREMTEEMRRNLFGTPANVD
ncbi:thiol:disulfide oxidoreductase [Lysobacter maris]|uniref:Thiol:disulfide oxidoreductase n=1 Tax=Marilutibacter maris TaxID=1605891 RepID=A0A508AVI8_9GAMM|nr:glutathione S-transferase C-terminal domain-containing protein [Lysobacter maris]KAB8191375.1 thiol:disulfide oxidoreductase [Lysobacter maris]